MVLRPTLLSVMPLNPSVPRPAITVPVFRAGMVLFSPASNLEDWKILVQKPISRLQSNGAPLFQLAKGSRQVRIDGKWQDVDDVPEEKLRSAGEEDYEYFVTAALRELREETGATFADIQGPIYDAGPFLFNSTRGPAVKAFHMFAAQAKDPEKTFSFDPNVTEAVRWMTLKEFNATGRHDQRATVQAILEEVEKVRQPGAGKAAVKRESPGSGRQR